MTRLFFALLLVASAALVGGAAAQTNETTTEEPTTVAVEIDSTTRVESFEYVNGSWQISFDLDVPKTVVLVDGATAMQAWEDADGKTASDVPEERYSLDPGTTTVRFPGATYDGQAAVTVSTNAGRKFLATDGIERGQQPVPADLALGGMVVTGLGAAYVSHRRVKSKYEERDREVERII